MMLTQLVPARAAIGDPAFTLYVKGAGFTPTSVIIWNGGAEVTTFLGPEALTTGVDMSTAVNPSIMPVYVEDAGLASNVLEFVLAAESTPSCPLTVEDLAAELGGQVVTTDPRALEAVEASCGMVLADLAWEAWPPADQVPAPIQRALVGLAVDLFRAPSTAFGYHVTDVGFASTGIDQVRRWRYLLDPYRTSWGLG